MQNLDNVFESKVDSYLKNQLHNLQLLFGLVAIKVKQKDTYIRSNQNTLF